jgi:hypothetical protein
MGKIKTEKRSVLRPNDPMGSKLPLADEIESLKLAKTKQTSQRGAGPISANNNNNTMRKRQCVEEEVIFMIIFLIKIFQFYLLNN